MPWRALVVPAQRVQTVSSINPGLGAFPKVMDSLFFVPAYREEFASPDPSATHLAL